MQTITLLATKLPKEYTFRRKSTLVRVRSLTFSNMLWLQSSVAKSFEIQCRLSLLAWMAFKYFQVFFVGPCSVRALVGLAYLCCCFTWFQTISSLSKMLHLRCFPEGLLYSFSCVYWQNVFKNLLCRNKPPKWIAGDTQ